jgi:hypothetical protein
MSFNDHKKLGAMGVLTLVACFSAANACEAYGIPGTEADIGVGDVYTLMLDSWGKIASKKSIKSDNNSFEFGDSCLAHSGGAVKVLGFSPDKSLTLLNYNVRVRPNMKTWGTACPDGAKIWIGADELDSVTPHRSPAVIYIH